MTALDKLIEAVEAGDDRISSYLPAEHEALWPKFCLAMQGSLDAALALHEALLPGWRVERLMQDDGLFDDGSWEIQIAEAGGDWFSASHTTPARAWLLAILRAYRSVQA